MSKRMSMGLVLIAAGTAMAADDTVKLGVVSTGAMPKLGGYMPQKLTLSNEKPATLKKAPEGLEAPRYAVLPIAGEPGMVFHLVLDEPDGKPARLFVDTNGNGDLTDDAAAEWKAQERNGSTMYNGTAMVEIGGKGSAFPAGLGLYRFDKNDPKRAALKDTILYYGDYGREGEITLGGKTYKAMIADEGTSGSFAAASEAAAGPTPMILIDVNGNGKFDVRGEKFGVAKAFNIGGTTYEIAEMTRTGDSFKIVKSAQTVAEVPTPPDHSNGKKITAFEMPNMDGKTVKFPSDYKGKVVMLDFWATWCGPCMGEVPGLVETYKKYHGQGFEVLGVSLDQANAAEKVKQVTGENGMTWPQIYDGKFWKAEVADKYAINSIPATFLVDGDTGEIIAQGGELRGEALAGTIEKALAKKKGK